VADVASSRSSWLFHVDEVDGSENSIILLTRDVHCNCYICHRLLNVGILRYV
jgi:hypothetical protein